MLEKFLTSHTEFSSRFQRRVVLLENVKCGGGATCYNGRRFSMDLDKVGVTSSRTRKYADLNERTNLMGFKLRV